MRMKGMVAIVTGGSRGLGRVIARAYAREGAKVVVISRPNSPTGLPGTVYKTACDIHNTGGEALAVTCDVTNEEQVQAMVHQVMDCYGQIDVLVNNAGLLLPNETILTVDPDRWDQLMNVNLRGPYLTCRCVLPVMIEQRSGSVINVSSKLANVAMKGNAVYGSSKSALDLFTLCLAKDVREHNIAVNVLSPGGLKSEGAWAIPYLRSNNDEGRQWNTRAELEDVIPSAVYLALQSAETFTGHVVIPDEFGIV